MSSDSIASPALNAKPQAQVPAPGRVLVTGATGFVGHRLCQWLAGQGVEVNGAVRQSSPENVELVPPPPFSQVAVGEINGETDWKAALEGVSQVVHLAALAHLPNPDSAQGLAHIHAVNVEGAVNLARQALAAGVKRLVFVSSAKVYGEATNGHGHAWDETTPPDPQEPYAASKWEAEQALQTLLGGTPLELVVVRPPLVYGPGVKANMLRLLKLAASGRPMPLGSLKNERTFVALDNLCDLLRVCLTHPAAAGQVFNAGEEEPLSTPVLLRRMARHLQSGTKVCPMPLPLVRLAFTLLGQGGVWAKLGGDLRLNVSKSQQLLGWQPPLLADDALQQMTDWYLKQ